MCPHPVVDGPLQMVVHELLVAPVDDVDVVANERGRYLPGARPHLGKIDSRTVRGALEQDRTWMARRRTGCRSHSGVAAPPARPRRSTPTSRPTPRRPRARSRAGASLRGAPVCPRASPPLICRARSGSSKVVSWPYRALCRAFVSRFVNGATRYCSNRAAQNPAGKTRFFELSELRRPLRIFTHTTYSGPERVYS